MNSVREQVITDAMHHIIYLSVY